MILNENEKSPLYLFDLVSNLNRVHETRHSSSIPAIHVRHAVFSRTHYFLLLHPSETNLKGKLETGEVFQLLKRIS